MISAGPTSGLRIDALDPELHLALSLLVRYLFFVSRRPISSSNRSFLVERVAGLRSLASVFSNRSSPLLDEIAARLRRMTPETVGDVMSAVGARITPALPKRTDDDVLVTTRPPDAAFLGSCRRMRLILGPAIGIGDEAICVSVPGWLRAAAPQADVEVLTTRPELWAGVAGVANVAAYADHLALLDALRGNGVDLVMLADFERPALAPALSRGPAPARYVELSIGGRTLDAYDATARCLHELARPSAYGANYYDFVADAMRWLGTPATTRDRHRPADRSERGAHPDRPLTIVVSPFTSKYEPSEAAWSALLGALFPPGAPGAARLVFDAGASLTAERFACGLAAATRAVVASGIACDVASEPPSRTLSRPGVLHLIAQADVVICADTFAAHVAPLGGCTTLVVANPSLANWRVPHAPVFYFDDAGAPPEIARGMRRVLAAGDRRFAGPLPARPWGAIQGAALVAATADLASTLARDAEAAAVLAGYRQCSTLLRELVSTLPDWPEDFRLLLSDRIYRRLLPPLRSLEGAIDRVARADLAAHVSHALGVWENSNLHKYLAVAGRSEAV